MNSGPSGANGHVTDLEMAAYLDRRLSTADRSRIEDHLARCAECRQHILGSQQVIERTRRPRRLVVGGTLAAAALAVFLIVRPKSERADEQSPSGLLRGTSDATTLVAYGPTGSVPLAGLRFVWGATPNVASYRLTVSRTDAAPVWSGSATDTTAILPRSVVLREGDRYYWIADALLTDGTTRSTGLREFSPVR
jgi:hypothetical protein